jgi:hypothetical protein
MDEIVEQMMFKDVGQPVLCKTVEQPSLTAHPSEETSTGSLMTLHGFCAEVLSTY